ncbi:MAG: RhuM family protein [Candidatus Gracilibacteria bacterium]|nr:RhuM family protein [Candidatus Gracilibacteria bacterium]
MSYKVTTNKIIIYDDKVDLFLDSGQETIWASQAQIAEFFDIDRTVVTKHIRNILKTEELAKNRVCAKFAHTAEDGKVYQVQHYNLDMILSVGYRINSIRATKFRQWATARLKEYLVQGYAFNEKRLAELHKTIQLIGNRADEDSLTLKIKSTMPALQKNKDNPSFGTRFRIFHFLIKNLCQGISILPAMRKDELFISELLPI